MTRIASLALFALLLAFAGREARATTIYKCTDANGTVTMQNDKPCAAGQKQEVRTIGELPTAPPPAPRAVDVRPPSEPPPGASFELVRGPVTDPLPESQLPAEERKPPPPLFECKTWEQDIYLSDTDTQTERCAPPLLRTRSRFASIAPRRVRTKIPPRRRSKALALDASCRV